MLRIAADFLTNRLLRCDSDERSKLYRTMRSLMRVRLRLAPLDHYVQRSTEARSVGAASISFAGENTAIQHNTT